MSGEGKMNIENTDSSVVITTKTVSKLKIYVIKDEFIRRGLRFSAPFASSMKTSYEDFQKTPGKLCYVTKFHNPELYPNVAVLKAKFQEYLSSLGVASEKLVYMDWKMRRVSTDAIAHFQSSRDLQDILALGSASGTLSSTFTSPPPFVLTPLTETQEIAYYQEIEVRKETIASSQMMVKYQANMLEALMKSLQREEALERSIQQGARIGSVCTVCFKEFPSRSALFKHLRIHQQGTLRVSSSVYTDDNISDQVSRDNVDKRDYGSSNVKMTYDSLEEEPTIVYEDDYVRVVKKPQGLSTQGERGCPTLRSSSVLDLKTGDTTFFQQRYRKAVPCHRLDKLTGGLVICSKFKEMETFLGYCFSHKCIKKRYRALCPGTIQPATGVIDSPISGKDSITRYQVVEVTPSFRFGTITTVDLWPLQGRRHQLRIHLKSIGHAILGDPKYSPYIFATPDENKMCLWAVSLEYPDPSVYVTTKKGITDEGKTVAIDVRPHDESEKESEEPDENVQTIMEKDREFSSVQDSSNYNVETLLQGVYKSVQIVEPELFEIVRSTQQLNANTNSYANGSDSSLNL